MSHLISRILLAILLFPLASLVYIVVFITAWRTRILEDWLSPNDTNYFIMAAGITWLFLGFYWYFLWRGSVRMTGTRLLMTLAAAVVAAIVGLMIGVLISGVEREVASFVGSAAAPLLWLVATCFLWRESREERAGRLVAGRETIVCPACGYNLTGLSATRCPECGKQYALDELLAAQPSRIAGELQTSD